MKDYLKSTLILLIIETATFIPLFIAHSLYEHKIDFQLFIFVYATVFFVIQFGLLINWLISPLLDKIAGL